MARTENQKAKLLNILSILREKTDDLHPIPTAEIIKLLEERGIKAERKSIYGDICELQSFGYDIEFSGSRKNGGYYLGAREFELAELKILVDMVQSSRFLSKKKSKILIEKLESLASCYQAKELEKSVFVANRAKAENETVFYSVDTINRAILSNKSISFAYSKYDISKEQFLRREGKIYNVSPYYLTWNNEYYYLVGVDNTKSEIRNYRVDRMKRLEISEAERQCGELFQNFSIATYTNSAFGMFGGKKDNVRLSFENSLIDVVIDRFGKEVSVRKIDDNHFSTLVEVVPSEQFYGWLAGFGTKVKIVAPESVKEAYKQYITDIYVNS